MQKPRFTVILQTTNATATTAGSIPVPTSKGVTVMVEFNGLKSTKDTVVGGYANASFYRASGDVTRTASNTNQGLIVDETGNFTGSQPYIDIVANAGTQSIDIKAVGKAATTIDWIIKYHFIMQ